MDARRDVEYFEALMGGHKQDSEGQATDTWNSRADDWADLLSRETHFKKSLDERVTKVSEYLRGRGLLGGDCRVADIGCGPGRFVAEFAKTCKHAVGIDLSDKMLDYGKSYARSMGVENTSYRACDFIKADIRSLGWEADFDLVFTSITPAIGNMDCLRKAMAMSRGYCFNSCFIHFNDELENQMARDLFSGDTGSAPLWNGNWFYALFNILWLEGFYPETLYHKQSNLEDAAPDDELIRYFTRLFSKTRDANDPDISAKVYDYLRSKTRPDGTVARYTERLYGWTLWDVRNRDARSSADIG